MSDVHSGARRAGESLSASVGDVSNTLLLSPGGSVAKHEACSDMLREVECGDAALLGVVSGDPERFLSHLNRQFGGVPSSTSVVAFDDDYDDDHAERSEASVAPDVERVGATDGVSTRVQECVADYGEDTPVHVCFDSLSGAVDALGRQRVFRFVNGLTTQCSTAGVTAHYHMDPERHDQRTLDALTTLFDAVATAPDGDAWEVAWTRTAAGESRD